MDTGSGGVELVAVTAPEVNVDTGSGGVEVELLGRVESLEVDTGSGSVTVRLPASLDAEIEKLAQEADCLQAEIRELTGEEGL